MDLTRRSFLRGVAVTPVVLAGYKLGQPETWPPHISGFDIIQYTGDEQPARTLVTKLWKPDMLIVKKGPDRDSWQVFHAPQA